MTPAERAALAAQRAIYGEPVVYTGAGLAGATITATKAETPADEFQGYNGKGRRITFEIDMADLPEQPAKHDTILHDGTTWQVQDINPRDDIAAFVLFVKKP